MPSEKTFPGLSQHNLSLYTWFKSDPKKNNRSLYPRWRAGVPTVLLKYAAMWFDMFVEDEQRHPGDGLLYFHDFILAWRDKPHDDFAPKKIPSYTSLFNYWYSFSAEKNGPLTIASERILSLILFNNPRLAVPLYEFRRQIDLKAFTRFAPGLLKERGLRIDEFNRDKSAFEVVEHWLWEAILGLSFPRMSGEWQIRMLHLWAGYTPDAVKRFVTLHLSVRRDLRLYLTMAESLYLETKSLIECQSVALVDECQIPKMSSVGMMKKFHDAEHIEYLREQILRNKAVYKWPDILTNTLIGISEWYIPTMEAEVLLRGTLHGHCVGAYAERHFQPPTTKDKVLLLFSDMYTAEIRLRFRGGKISKVIIGQVKGFHNKNAPDTDVKQVFKIAKRIAYLPANAFFPEKVSINNDEATLEADRLLGSPV